MAVITIPEHHVTRAKFVKVYLEKTGNSISLPRVAQMVAEKKLRTVKYEELGIELIEMEISDTKYIQALEKKIGVAVEPRQLTIEQLGRFFTDMITDLVLYKEKAGKEVKNLKDALDASESEKTGYREKCEKLEMEVATLKQTIAKQQNDIRSLISQKEEENTRYMNEAGRQRDIINGLKTEIETSKKHADFLAVESQKFAGEIEALKAVNAQLQDISSLKEDFKKMISWLGKK